MNIKTEKVCTYTIHDNIFTRSDDFLTIEEIKGVISKINCSEPHIVSVDLEERAIDKDDKSHAENGTVLKKESIEKISFCIVDNLLYPADVQTIISKKHNFYFEVNQYDPKIPVICFSVKKRELPGMRVNGRPTTQTFHDISFEQAKPTDIIFNKNLEQLYGQRYNLLGKLNEMLAQTRGS
ncbi:MAG: hypothetical protein J5714_03920 [Alphaproteobacteria bacterium]|nr:hypothetical protein [Alphaproteobacteria bacterium]